MRNGKMRVATVVIVGLLLLVLAVPAYVYWRVFVEHVYDPGAASTAADVVNCIGIAPPAEARDLRVATFEFGQARNVFVRFTAPVEVCEKFATAIMPVGELKPVGEHEQYNDSIAIYMGSRALSDLRWFDLPYANVFWSGGPGKPVMEKPEYDMLTKSPQIIGADGDGLTPAYMSSSVRVDTARGVFYVLMVN